MLRIAFAGTPPFAATALAALLEAHFPVTLVLTQPDRPAGRGQRLRASAVKRLAQEHGLAIAEPERLRPGPTGDGGAAAIAQLHASSPDLLVVAAYGLLLPPSVLDIARGVALPGGGRVTAVNIHASLLPRWRGAAPVARAIEAGDRETGITIMQMDAGLDTGPMLLCERLSIAPDSTAATLTDQLARLGARAVVSTLHALAQGRLAAHAQPASGVTYARKIEKREAWLDWSEAAGTLANRVRAFDPFPVACADWEGQTIKIWRAEASVPEAVHGLEPGTVIASGAKGVLVACGTGALCLTELQRAGGRRLAPQEFLAGLPVAPGTRWSAAPRQGP